MQKVVILIGIPGAGKSTKAKSWMKHWTGTWKRINKDALREMLDCGEYSSENEGYIQRVQADLITSSLKRGYNLIIDNTNIPMQTRRRIHKQVEAHAAMNGPVLVSEVVLDIPLETCLAQNEQRKGTSGYVDPTVIKDFHKRFVDANPIPTGRLYQKQVVKNTQHDPTKKKVVVCDIDGTIAMLNGRDPYNAGLCSTDTVNQAVLECLNNFDHTHRARLDTRPVIFFLTGRDDKWRPQTEAWLKEHVFFPYHLLMRPTGDQRKDYVVKKEIINNVIFPDHYVVFALDDRPSVIRMLREELGLTVFQLNDKEF